MKKIIFAILLVSQGGYICAQDLYRVVHEIGSCRVGDNTVQITAEGAPSYALCRDIGPFRIGHKHRKNSYTFQFAHAVKKIQLHFTAVEYGEQIRIEVNGITYMLKQSEIFQLSEADMQENGVISKGGILTPANQHGGTALSCMVVLSIEKGISTVTVKHLNGQMDGCIFSMYFESTIGPAITDRQSTISKKMTRPSKLEVFPNPTTGDFTLKGDAFSNISGSLAISNTLGQTVCEKLITPANFKFDEKIHLESSLASGVYNATIQQGDLKQTFQIVLQR